jgi:hypothetical protein
MAAPRIPIELINSRLPEKSALKAIEYVERHVSPSGFTRSKVKCQCKCGNFKECVVADLIRGNPLSCGKCESTKPAHRKVLYKRWYDMIERCYNEETKNYKVYGLQGVIVCDEWLESFDSFYNWSIANGFSPELQLDKDILGDGKLYSPDTCKWATALENMGSTKKAIKYNFNGELMTIPQISRKTGVLQSILKFRVKSGMKIEDAVKSASISSKYAKSRNLS